MFALKVKITYFLFFVCLTGVFCVSFNSTFKLFKQSVSFVLSDTDIDDMEEEDETEKKEIEEDAKIISEFHKLDLLFLLHSKSDLNPIDAKLVSMSQNIQSPPPKI